MMKRVHDTKRTTTILMVAGFIIVAITALGMAYYTSVIANTGLQDTLEPQDYTYHYVMITEERDSPLWQSIYQYAKTAAAENDAYVEWLGANLSVEYSLPDLMRIAIKSRVDGIILEPNGDPEIVELINEASNQNIPVVTILEDETQSMRKSFIGVNSYDLGQQYGTQVLDVMDASTKNILVLLSEENDAAGKYTIYTQIKEMVAENTPSTQVVTVNAVNINTDSPFDSAEAIRNIFVDSDMIPDILVCLSAVDTESAYNTVSDFYLFGDVKIIGYYSTDSIISAVKKNNISAIFKMDAEQLGRNSVEALSDFIRDQYVNDYWVVDVDIINSYNVDDYYIEPQETAAK
jgi:ribose transport system substrate-binding protein